MKITPEIHSVLVNTAMDHEKSVWRDARLQELISVPYTNDDAIRVNELCDSLLERVSTHSREWATGTNYNPETHKDIINESVMMLDLHMLEFFDRLMTRAHGADLLRIIFIHATNFGIPLDSITDENVEAYQKSTSTVLTELNTRINIVAFDDSERIIRRVLISRHDAAVALRFMDEHGNRTPDLMLEHLKASEGILPVLTDGVI